MGRLSKDIYKRLVLLYAVGRFRGGVSSFGLQKALYHAMESRRIRPFGYCRGPYSPGVHRALEELVDTGHLILDKDGKQWSLADRSVRRIASRVVRHSLAGLAKSINHSVKKYRKESLPLHGIPDNQETPSEETIFEENLPDYIDVGISYDHCEDLELALNPEFIAAMLKLVKMMEDPGFPDFVSKVKKITDLDSHIMGKEV